MARNFPRGQFVLRTCGRSSAVVNGSNTQRRKQIIHIHVPLLTSDNLNLRGHSRAQITICQFATIESKC
ncbi:unnamed protein product [Calicophoron daubneyi]|uniref:Uncharacterized protein n=1 Tax=Calicophoron daubneyi TaxID=300641 RepID=A0AAV2TDT0_CALDB